MGRPQAHCEKWPFPLLSSPFSHLSSATFLSRRIAGSACLRCESLQMISSRDLVLVSTATIFGVGVSAFAFRRFSLFSSNSSERATTNGCKREKAGRATNGVIDERKSRRQDPYDSTKRRGYLSWDDYFMALAFLSAKRSKDPKRQVGACLVSQKGIILGIGYNGFPRGCSDDKLPWAKKSKNNDPLETKYPYVCHAEVNAILNTNHASAAGQKLYVTMFPCNECAKIIIQAGVSEVIYYVEKMFENSDTTYAASHVLFTLANIKVRRHQPEMDELLINFRDH